jgi:hypothetical protein
MTVWASPAMTVWASTVRHRTQVILRVALVVLGVGGAADADFFPANLAFT